MKNFERRKRMKLIFNLQKLPDELIIEIVKFLDKTSTINFALTSKDMKKMALHEAIFKQFCERFVETENHWLFHKNQLKQLFNDVGSWKKVYNDILLKPNDVNFFLMFFLDSKFHPLTVFMKIRENDKETSSEEIDWCKNSSTSIHQHQSIKEDSIIKKWCIKDSLLDNMQRYCLEMGEKHPRYSFDTKIGADDTIKIHLDYINKNLYGIGVTKGQYYRKLINCGIFEKCIMEKLHMKFKKQFQFVGCTSVQNEIPQFNNVVEEMIDKTMKKKEKTLFEAIQTSTMFFF